MFSYWEPPSGSTPSLVSSSHASIPRHYSDRYLLNTMSQLLFMNIFLSTEFHMYGITVIRNLLTLNEWPESERFPRVTLCDFKVSSEISVLLMHLIYKAILKSVAIHTHTVRLILKAPPLATHFPDTYDVRPQK